MLKGEPALEADSCGATQEALHVKFYPNLQIVVWPFLLLSVALGGHGL